MIKKISLDEMLKIKSLKDKEYLIRKRDDYIKGDPVIIELQCKGFYGKDICVNSRLFKKTEISN